MQKSRFDCSQYVSQSATVKEQVNSIFTMLCGRANVSAQLLFMQDKNNQSKSHLNRVAEYISMLLRKNKGSHAEFYFRIRFLNFHMKLLRKLMNNVV